MIEGSKYEYHDRALYSFEGETNYPLHPNGEVSRAAGVGFSRGFDAGWAAATDLIIKVIGEAND